MLVKNLMEKKQLDFNQPLLSVRKFCSTVSTAAATDAENKIKLGSDAATIIYPLPFYKSELKSGPVSNPGTVPFVWEQSPGRPKDHETKPKPLGTDHELPPPLAPKLPPGRILNARLQVLDRDSETKAVVGSSLSRIQNGSCCSSQDDSSLDKILPKNESLEGEAGGKGSCSKSEDGDDQVYEDALDTLSRSESFFLNCSISGLSGLEDGLELMKASGTSSVDPHTRDFMMGRFLPAAKAMASESPQYSSSRKQPPIAREETRGQGNKQVVTVPRRLSANHYGLNRIPHYAQGNRLEESDDDVDDFSATDHSSFGVCGLFSRLCAQNSFCLLNPIPGIRKHSEIPISSVRLARVKSSYAAASGSEPEKKRDRDSVQGQKLDGSYYKQLRRKGTSPCRNLSSQSTVNEGDKGFPVPGIPEKAKSSMVSNNITQCTNSECNFRELLSREKTEWDTEAESTVAERTLYIDRVHDMKPQSLSVSSSDVKELTDCTRKDVDVGLKGREIEEAPAKSPIWEVKSLNDLGERAKLLPESLGSLDSCFSRVPDESNHDVDIDVKGCSGKNQDPMLRSTTLTSPKPEEGVKVKTHLQSWRERTIINSQSQFNKQSGNQGLMEDVLVISTTSKVADNGKNDFGIISQRHMQLSDDQEASPGSFAPLPLGPPLPRSPTESWLMRALPTLSSQSSYSRSPLASHLHPKAHASAKLHSSDLKWETILKTKTSNVQNRRLLFSEKESLAPIPEA